MTTTNLERGRADVRRALNRHDFRSAATGCRMLLDAAPKDPATHMLFSEVLYHMGDFEGMIEHGETGAKLAPRAPDVRAALGWVYLVSGALTKALAQFEKALKLAPDHARAVAGQATVFEYQGKRKRIFSLLRGRKPLTPDLAAILIRALVSEDDPEQAIATGEAVLAAQPAPTMDVAHVHFALIRAYEKQGRFDDAFAAATAANAIIAVPFTSEPREASLAGIRAAFTPERLAAMPRATHRPERPIFIVGMPRTGSTLTERVLHAHPLVHGADEITTMHLLIESLPERLGRPERYPDCVPSLTAEVIDDLARAYDDTLIALAPKARFVINKDLGNYVHLGFISLVCPAARIIHCRRDPVDTCLSCFTERLRPETAPYASDLGHLGRAYRSYQEHMAYWKDTIDLEMLEIDYEDLIADQEGTTRRLLDFCDLEWDDACLRFHESKRRDRTLSYDQVRRPLYRSSVRRADGYGDHLAPLRAALAGQSGG